MKLYNDGLIQAAFYSMDAVEIQEGTSVESLVYDVSEETLDILSMGKNISSLGKMVFVKNGRILKKMAHIEGAPHMAAHIWIFNSKGEVLIQKRSSIKDSYPDLWDISAAGHISSGETMLDGALREMTEEIGLTNTKSEDLIPVGYFREEVKFPMKGYENGWHNNELNGIFVLQYEGKAEDLTLQVEEVAEVKFIPISQLEAEWNDPVLSELHVPKAWEYRENIIAALKEATKKFL